MFGLSRSVLKWIALITMAIDHIGAIIGADVFAAWNLLWLYHVLRVIGRIAFPIFAFFIAEGWHYTSNRKRYALLILLFAIITQPIYYFALNENIFDLNILFTFLFAILMFILIDQMKKDSGMAIFYSVLMVGILAVVFILDSTGITVSYGIYGVLLPTLFYVLYNAKFKYHKILLWALAALLMIAHWLFYFLLSTKDFFAYTSLFTLLALPLLACYNGEKGKHSPKWLFYIFYPAHLLIIYLFTLLI